MTTGEMLIRGIRDRGGAGAAAWLEEAIPRARAGLDGLLESYTMASTRLGAAPFEPPSGAEADAAMAFDRWHLEDAGRLALLLARLETATDPAAFAEDARACYEQGDAREQASWLRGVALLPDAGRYLPIVIDACRTNILPVFESVACENPYPSRHFPERNFNQMVLKALFNNVPLSRIVGLAARANAELARMAADYAAERRAAGRSVPADIGLATG